MVVSTHNRLQNYIAIDPGYFSTKFIYNNIPKILRSKVEQVEEHSSNGFTITYNNQSFLIGKEASEINIDVQKHNSLDYKIIIYGILATLGSGEYVLGATYPLNYLNKESKQKFTDYLKTNLATIKYKDTEYKISIPSVYVLPQTASAIQNNSAQYKDKTIGIIDIGGLTASGCIFNNLVLERSSIFTYQHGSLHLFSEIKQELNKQFYTNIQDYEIPNIISNGLLGKEQESLLLINKIIIKYLKEIYKQAKIKKWNIDNIEIVFTGGTSLHVKENLSNIFAYSKLSQEPIFDNVKGVYTILPHLMQRGV